LSLKEEDVDLLEELFLQEGIIFDPNSITDIDSACQDTASEEISLLMQAVEDLKGTVEEVAAPVIQTLTQPRCCGANLPLSYRLSGLQGAGADSRFPISAR